MKKPKPGTGRTRRTLQLLSLGLFLYLLAGAAWPAGKTFLPPDFYLRLDPLATLIIPLSAREFIYRLIPGLALLGVTALLGRFFCGHFCPFGITLDLFGRLKGSVKTTGPKSPLGRASSNLKYLVLTAMTAGALAGYNLGFWGSPIALITRFYALFLEPALAAAGNSALDLGRPLLESMGIEGASYLSFQTRAFDSLLFIITFFGLVFFLEWRSPRFWCRVLCPAGALLALISLKPLWRRRVDGCVNCGLCARRCPASALRADGRTCSYRESLTCQRCVEVCPAGAVNFKYSRPAQSAGPAEPAEPAGPWVFPPISRRAFLGSAAAGLGLSLAFPLVSARASAPTPVRPPGAMPEPDFLNRCLRCGQCLKACPSNALAPGGFSMGLATIFSPYLLARRGPCEPDCHRCGQVCPTGAVLDLPLAEKRWAKMGTARVLKESCLAWAEDRRCVVCQEVCPYAAIDLGQEGHHTVPVPLVDAARCYGCGYCEFHCPVEKTAIVVEATGALRLNAKSYRAEAVARGLELDPLERASSAEPPEAEALPPGFIDLD